MRNSCIEMHAGSRASDLRRAERWAGAGACFLPLFDDLLAPRIAFLKTLSSSTPPVEAKPHRNITMSTDAATATTPVPANDVSIEPRLAHS